MARTLFASLLAALFLSSVVVDSASACPFCTATAQTFSEEIGTMDAVVVAKLVELPPTNQKPGDEIGKAKFEIVDVIKGESVVKKGEVLETLFFGEGKTGQTFLVMGIDPPKVMWSTPLPLSSKAREYLNHVLKLPKDGLGRYIFFQNYLEDTDEMLARDAYDEFAKAPYATVKQLKEHMNREQIIANIKNPDVPASRRRLYLVMLGVCGQKSDVPMLEGFMKSDDRKDKAGLDALVACYLTLRGDEGLPVVEELFLANKKSDYADTYAAIMALRFHGSDGGVIDKSKLVKSLHYMLERPELADLVIPDLAKWEDWSAMDQLMELYKKADEKTSWVRVPVINYLRACPLPKAKELLAECEKIDPAAVKRANTFYPAGGTPVPDANKASRDERRQRRTTAASFASITQNADVALASAEMPELDEEDDATEADSAPRLSGLPTTGLKPAIAAATGPQAAVNGSSGDEVAVSVNPGAKPAAAIKQVSSVTANRWVVVGVPWAVGLSLLVVQWSLLRGRR
jgi:hypothetical protein